MYSCWTCRTSVKMPSTMTLFCSISLRIHYVYISDPTFFSTRSTQVQLQDLLRVEVILALALLQTNLLAKSTKLG